MIICEACEKTLDPIDLSKIEKKLCLDCIQKLGSNMILDFSKDHEKTKKQKRDNYAQVDLEMGYVKLEDKLLCLVRAKLKNKQESGDFIEFGFSLEQLKSFIEEMEEINKGDEECQG